MVRAVSFMQFVEKSEICSFREFAFFVDQRHYVHRSGGDQVQGLLIIDEFYVLPIDALQVVLFLFQLEDMSDEELLQIFVGIVDAKLFKAIDLEVLKPKDIEDTDGGSVVTVVWLRLVDGRIDFADDPDKHSTVNAFDERVSHVQRLLPTHGGDHSISVSEDGSGGQRVYQVLLVHV